MEASPFEPSDQMVEIPSPQRQLIDTSCRNRNSNVLNSIEKADDAEGVPEEPINLSVIGNTID